MNKEQFDMTSEELIEFFNKYNILELESFNMIFEFVKDYDMTDVLKCARKVYNDKYKECDENYESIARHAKFKITDILNKNEKLNLKELTFLHTLTDDALMYLSSIEHIDVEEELLNVDKIVETVNTEINKRKKETKVKVKM